MTDNRLAKFVFELHALMKKYHAELVRIDGTYSTDQDPNIYYFQVDGERMDVDELIS